MRPLHKTSDVALFEFWHRHLGAPKSTALGTTAESRVWYLATPSSIASAAGSVDLALLSYLMRRFKLRSPILPSQFVYGFRPAGRFSQAGVFPPVEKGSSTIGPLGIYSMRLANVAARDRRAKPYMPTSSGAMQSNK